MCNQETFFFFFELVPCRAPISLQRAGFVRFRFEAWTMVLRRSYRRLTHIKCNVSSILLAARRPAGWHERRLLYPELLVEKILSCEI